MMMTGRAPAGRLRITSNPPIWGICKSRKTRSGCRRAMSRRASLPLAASPTILTPEKAASSSRSTSRATGSSSTMRVRSGGTGIIKEGTRKAAVSHGKDMSGRNSCTAGINSAASGLHPLFHGELAPLAQPAAFEALCQRASDVKWVAYAKRPFGGPEQVLKYLARYTHRVAISNQRLLSLQDGRVTFEWKDYAAGNHTKTMTLEAVEFIRRFLLHVLPSGLVHIRHFGFLANRNRKEKLALCRSLLPTSQVVIEASADSPHDATLEERLSRRCPVCQTGRLILVPLDRKSVK